MTQPTLLILAAGMGSRYGGFKQIDPIGPDGEIIIDYSIYDALRAGFGKIVILTRPEIEAPLREHFANTVGDAPLAYAYQKLDDLPDGFALPAGREKPWGTAHAIWAARQQLDTPFGVINADDFYGPQSFQILHEALRASRQPGDCCMVGFELAKTLSLHGTVSRGICRADADGFLSDVTEHTKIEPDAAHGARTLDAVGNWNPIAPDSITSMNLWGFDPSILDHLETGFREFLASEGGAMKSEFFITSAVNRLIRSGAGRCKVLKTPEQWFGMTYKEDRELAIEAIRSLILAGAYPQKLRRH
jgi:dTDP-glucose pyrophosphorylase